MVVRFDCTSKPLVTSPYELYLWSFILPFIIISQCFYHVNYLVFIVYSQSYFYLPHNFFLKFRLITLYDHYSIKRFQEWNIQWNMNSSQKYYFRFYLIGIIIHILSFYCLFLLWIINKLWSNINSIHAFSKMIMFLCSI